MEKSKFSSRRKKFIPFVFPCRLQPISPHYSAQINLLMFLMRAERRKISEESENDSSRLSRLISRFLAYQKEIFHHDELMANITEANVIDLITMTKRKPREKR